MPQRDALDPSAVLNLGGAKQDTPRTGCSKTGYAGQLITILERTQKEYIHDHPSDRKHVSWEAARTLTLHKAANDHLLYPSEVEPPDQHLEKELGAAAFDETPKDVRLTRSGELLLGAGRISPRKYMTPWIWPGR